MNRYENFSPKQPRRSCPSSHPGPGADAGGWSISTSNRPPYTKPEWLEERMTQRVPNMNFTVNFSQTRVPKINKKEPCTKIINASALSAKQDHNEGEAVPPRAGCSKQFKSIPDLQEHQRMCDPGPGRHLCSKCNVVYKSVRAIQTHYKNDHFEDYTFSCRQCNKVYYSVSLFRTHKKTHLKHKPFKCSQCGEVFGRKYTLDNHILTHSEDRNFKCSVCGDRFKTRPCLSQHNRLHLRDKPFKCDKCGKEFVRKNYLDKHILYCEKRTFRCTVCGDRFYTRSIPSGPKRTSSQDTLFKCKKCDMRCQKKISLDKRTFVHSEIKSFQCAFCNRRFKSSSDLSAHIRESHKHSIDGILGLVPQKSTS